MKTYKINETNKAEVLEQIKNDTKWLADFADECGYQVASPFWRDNELQLGFAPKDFDSYSPSIYVENPDCFNKLDKVSFKIGTVSYGSLNMEEYKKFMEATANAFRLADYLNSMSGYQLDKQIPTVEWEK